MSEHQPSHEVQGIVKARIWEKVLKNFSNIEGPNENSGRKFGATRTLPRADYLPDMTNRGRKALIGEVTKNLMVILTEL